jgi:hypothetical protein
MHVAGGYHDGKVIASLSIMRIAIRKTLSYVVALEAVKSMLKEVAAHKSRDVTLACFSYCNGGSSSSSPTHLNRMFEHNTSLYSTTAVFGCVPRHQLRRPIQHILPHSIGHKTTGARTLCCDAIQRHEYTKYFA